MSRIITTVFLVATVAISCRQPVTAPGNHRSAHSYDSGTEGSSANRPDPRVRRVMEMRIGFQAEGILHVSVRNVSGGSLWANSSLTLTVFEKSPGLGNLYLEITDPQGKPVETRCMINP